MHHGSLSLCERCCGWVDHGGGEGVVQRPEVVLRGEGDLRHLLLEETGRGGEVDEGPCKAGQKRGVVGGLLAWLACGLSDLCGR